VVVPLERVVFNQSPLYSQRPNPTSDEAWNKLLPEGRGFVFVPDWKKYDYPPGEETEWGPIYSTAVFHQMHCLGQLRRFSWMFLDAIVKNDTAQQATIKNMFVEMDHMEHMNHCLDYLRQTIQCGGDMTMEWPRTEPDGRRFAVDGWGIPHECKSWVSKSHPVVVQLLTFTQEKIQEYMEKAHFTHSMNNQIAPLVGASG